jgi:tetratricopeptide (TPR) repeat protein
MTSIHRFPYALLGLCLLLVLSCANPHFVGGKNYVTQKVWDKAAEELEVAVQQQPGNAEAWYYLGWAHGEMGNYERAAQAFRESKKLSDVFSSQVDEKIDGFWNDLAARGQDLERSGQYDQAAKTFEQAILLRPEQVRSQNFLANLYARMGQNDKAMGVYERALQLQPDNDTTFQNYAKFLDESGLGEKAIPSFEKLIAGRPEEYRTLRVAVLDSCRNHTRGDMSDADVLETCRDFLAGQPGKKELDPLRKEMTRVRSLEAIFHRVADLYLKAGDPGKAIELYRLVQDPVPLMNRAYDAFSADDYPAAFRYYGLAKEVAEPKSDIYFDASYNAIVSCFKMQDYPKAIELGEKLVAEKADEAQYWRILGNSYVRNKQTEKALEAHKKAEGLEKKGK